MADEYLTIYEKLLDADTTAEINRSVPTLPIVMLGPKRSDQWLAVSIEVPDTYV